MALFLSIHELLGNFGDLLAHKRVLMDPVTGRVAPGCGGIASVTVRTAGGLLTVNLWASREAAASLTRHPEARRVREAVGCRCPPASSATRPPAT